MSSALDRPSTWPVPHHALVVVGPDGVLGATGDLSLRLRIASVSKPLTACAVLVAVEEGAVQLDDPAGPEGSTVRHLLAHASGYGFDLESGVVGRPGAHRVYSNRGYDELAAHVERATEIPFAQYLTEAVFEPLEMTRSALEGSAAFAVHSTADDLARFAGWALRSSLRGGDATPVLSAWSFEAFTSVAFPGLDGVMPGVGRFDPLDWGLGPDRAFGREGHWAGTRVSSGTFGHFGGSGTFLWVDPGHRLAAVCLTDRDFGPWALQVWPGLCDDLVAEFGTAAPHPAGPTPVGVGA